MSTQELRLRYFIQLASNIGVTSRREAQEYERAQQQMGRATRDTDRSAKDLDRTLNQLASNTSVERQARFFDRLADSVGRAQTRARQLKDTLAQGLQNAPEMAAMGVAGYYGAKTMMAPPVRAYADLESATTDLRVAMMDAKKQVHGSFGAIAREAEKLGDFLPGSTKDFMGGASAMIRNGVGPETVANGGLRASSYFGVLMNMNQAQSAETIAKVREASGLKDNELVGMADLMQRGHYAFGIKPSDYLEVAKYAAPTYNTMGTTGLDNAKRMLALQGMAASVGLEGSSFGTNIAQMMNRLSQVDSRQERNSPEAKALRAMLKKHDIDLTFYDDKGRFMGPENMLAQLAKMRTLSPVDQQRATYQLFGDEAGRPAQVMIQKGLEEYNKNIAKLDAQASLDDRINEKMSSFAAKLDALGGTIENVMARMAAQLGNASKPAIDGANGFFGGVGQFLQDNPAAGTAGMVGLGLGGAVGAWRGSGALLGLVRGLRGGGGAAAAASVLSGAGSVLAPAGALAPAASAAVRSNPFSGLGVALPPASDPFRALFGGTASAAASAGARVPIPHGPFSGLGVGPAAASPSFLSRMTSAGGRWLGPGLAVAGLGLESYDVITDEQLTNMGKVKGVSAAFGGAAGAWGGAKAGALLGSAIMPGFGTVAGGLIGGAAGYMAGKSGVNWLWGDNPERDFVKLTAPNGSDMGGLQGGAQTTLQIGEGVLRLDVHIQNDGSVATNMATLQPMQLLRVESGATDPGSFAAMARGGR